MRNLCSHLGPMLWRAPHLVECSLAQSGNSEYFWNKGTPHFQFAGAPGCVADPECCYFILPMSFIPFPATTFNEYFKLAFGVIRHKLTTQFILLFCSCCFSLFFFFLLRISYSCLVCSHYTAVPAPAYLACPTKPPFPWEQVLCYSFVFITFP